MESTLTSLFNPASFGIPPWLTSLIPESLVDGIAEKLVPEDMKGIYRTLGKDDFLGLAGIFLPQVASGFLSGKADANSPGTKMFAASFASIKSDERAAIFDVLAETDNEVLKRTLVPEDGNIKLDLESEIFKGRDDAATGMVRMALLLKDSADKDAGADSKPSKKAEQFGLSSEQGKTIYELSGYLKGLTPEKRAALREFVAGDGLPKVVKNVASVELGGVNEMLGGVTKIDGISDGVATIGGGIAGGMLGSKILSALVSNLPVVGSLPFIGAIAGIIGFVIGMGGGAFFGDWANGKFGKDKEATPSAIEELEQQEGKPKGTAVSGPTDSSLKEKGGLAAAQKEAASPEKVRPAMPEADQKPVAPAFHEFRFIG